MRIRFYRRINYTYGGNWNEEAVDHCVILMSNVFVMLPHPHPHQHHSNDSRCSHWPYTTILSERFLSARRSQAAGSSASGRSVGYKPLYRSSVSPTLRGYSSRVQFLRWKAAKCIRAYLIPLITSDHNERLSADRSSSDGHKKQRYINTSAGDSCNSADDNKGIFRNVRAR